MNPLELSVPSVQATSPGVSDEDSASSYQDLSLDEEDFPPIEAQLPAIHSVFASPPPRHSTLASRDQGFSLFPEGRPTDALQLMRLSSSGDILLSNGTRKASRESLTPTDLDIFANLDEGLTNQQLTHTGFPSQGTTMISAQRPWSVNADGGLPQSRRTPVGSSQPSGQPSEAFPRVPAQPADALTTSYVPSNGLQFPTLSAIQPQWTFLNAYYKQYYPYITIIPRDYFYQWVSDFLLNALYALGARESRRHRRLCKIF